MAIKQKIKLDEINILRGIGILAVILIHITAKYSTESITYGTINKFLNFAVPLFLFISALVLMYQARLKGNVNFREFYIKRLCKVIIPYLIAIYIYFIYFGYMNYDFINPFINPWGFFYDYLLLGKMCYHFYFIPLIVQFYLIFPIIWIIVSKIKKRTYFISDRRRVIHYSIMFTLIGALLILLQYLFFDFNGTYIYDVFKYTGTILLSYIIPIGMGLWVGYNWEDWKRIKKFIRIVIYPIGILTGIIFIKASVTGIDIDVSNKVIGLIRTVYSTFIVLILLDLSIYISKKKGQFNEFLNDIGNHSFWIYLLHPLVLYILSDIDFFSNIVIVENEIFNTNIVIFYKFVTILLSSYFLAFTIAKIKIICLNLFNKKSRTSIQTKNPKIKNYTKEKREVVYYE